MSINLNDKKIINAALKAAYNAAMVSVASGYPQGYAVAAHVSRQFGDAEAELLAGVEVHTGPDLCAALGHATLDCWVMDYLSYEWFSGGSRVVGGSCGWSQDLPEDCEVEVEIEQETCQETGQTIEYRSFRYL